MPDRKGMHSNKRFVIGVEHWPFCRYAIDRVRSVEHNDCNSGLFTGAHAKIHSPDKGVAARADILQIDEQNIEILQHLQSRLAMFGVQRVNGNAKTRMLVAFPLHHVVLCLSKKSVLRAKERGKTKKIAVVSLQNSRRVFK